MTVNTAVFETGVILLLEGQVALRKQWNNISRMIIYRPFHALDDLCSEAK